MFVHLSNESIADANSDELTEAEVEIERQVFARVYDSAIFPNGDANIQTDVYVCVATEHN